MNNCTCPDGEAKCGACPNNPRCKHFVPSRNSKWFRCGNRESWGVCQLTKKDCPNCQYYKPPGLPGRPRLDEFFDPGLDDIRAYSPDATPEELRAETQKRYFEKKKQDENFKAERAAYMRSYRQRRKDGASSQRT